MKHYYISAWLSYAQQLTANLDETFNGLHQKAELTVKEHHRVTVWLGNENTPIIQVDIVPLAESNLPIVTQDRCPTVPEEEMKWQFTEAQKTCFLRWPKTIDPPNPNHSSYADSSLLLGQMMAQSMSSLARSILSAVAGSHMQDMTQFPVKPSI